MTKLLCRLLAIAAIATPLVAVSTPALAKTKHKPHTTQVAKKKPHAKKTVHKAKRGVQNQAA